MATNEVPSATVQSVKNTAWAIRFALGRKEWVFGMWKDQSPLEGAMLPEGKPRWHFLGAGVGLHVVALLLLLLLGLLFPDRVVQVRRYLAMEIAPIAPFVSASQPGRPRRPKLVPVVQRQTSDPPLPRPDIPPPIAAGPILKSSQDTTPAIPKIVDAAQTPLALNAPGVPRLQKPHESVQVGGFGAPSGLLGMQTAPNSNVPHVGGFNLPAGPVGGERRSGGIREGLFSNGQVSGSANKVVARTVEASSRSKPVVILYKPTPKYSDVARAKRIEGEVVLQVIFSASGEVKILRVIRGLGYGLDETAQQAAHEIKFRPAENEDGDAIDSTAIVHIVFQLAY